MMKSIIHRLHISRSLNQIDPGFLHTRQATRTVLSVLFTALALQHAPFTAMFLACFASACVQQGLVGYRRREIFVAMLISGAAMLLYGFLALISINYSSLSDITLIIGAFFVFYVRRFGQRYSLFPVFVWLLGFTITIFVKSFAWNSALQILFAIFIGLSIAMILRLWLIPDIRAKQFSITLCAFFNEVRKALAKMKHQLKHMEQDELSDYLSKTKIKLRQLFIQNEAILRLCYGRANLSLCEKNLFRYLHYQYNAGKALIMVLHSLIELRRFSVLHHPHFSCFQDMLTLTKHNISYLTKNLHPIINYKNDMSVYLPIPKQLDILSNINTMMTKQYSDFDEVTLAFFKYQFNLQHLMLNLMAFNQHE